MKPDTLTDNDILANGTLLWSRNDYSPQKIHEITTNPTLWHKYLGWQGWKTKQSETYELNTAPPRGIIVFNWKWQNQVKSKYHIIIQMEI